MRAEHTRTAYPAGVLFGLSVALSLYVASAVSSLGWEGAGMLGAAMGAVHAMASVARGGAPRFMNAIISGLWITALVLGVTGHPDNPARALIELFIVASGLSWLWSWSSSTWPPRSSLSARSPRHGAAVGLMLSWGAMMALPLATLALYALCAGIWALVGLQELIYALRAKDRSWMRGLTPLLVVSQWVALVIGHDQPKLALSLGLVFIAPPLLKLWLQDSKERLKGPGFWEELVLSHPARAMFSSFGVLGLLGGLLLTMPAAAGTSRHVSLLDGVFTSFSAACVTGLAVLDTPNDFSFLGQLIILVLIQLGGLSIMAFSTMGVFLLGKRMSLRQEVAMSELLGSDNKLNLRDSLKAMMLVTIWTEGLGAALLTLCFWVLGDKPLEALWRGVFTSISAFCNAGFALQSDSLMSYQQRPVVLLVIALIITVGGLGPAASLAIGQRLARPKDKSHAKTNLQVKLILWTSLGLTASGFVLFLLMEWDNTLAPLGFVDKLTNAFFQSVTLRTAGFNSLDLAKLDPATLTLTLPYMFIGGSPGSTAGGAKTTTFALLVLLVISAIKGHDHTRAFGFQLPGRTVYRAAAVGTLSAFNVFVCLLLLQLTQPIALESLLFETVSALGTVGLSIGATGQLDGVGKVIIIASMFIGRLGPLTLFLVLTRRQGSQSQLVLPQQDVAVG